MANSYRLLLANLGENPNRQVREFFLIYQFSRVGNFLFLEFLLYFLCGYFIKLKSQ
jgi:hypothetical protein